MKAYTTLCLLFVFGCMACRKEVNEHHNPFLQLVQLSLKDSLRQDAYARLDFNRAVLAQVDSVSLYLLRIPFRGEKLENHFLLLQTNGEGKITRGRQVSFYRAPSESPTAFNGHITMHTLKGMFILDAAIVGGHIKRHHPDHKVH